MQYFFLILWYWDRKTCIISNDKKVISKILLGLDKFQKFTISNDKITVVKTNFSCAAFKNLSDKKRSKLSDSFLNQFAMLHKVKSAMRLVEDPVQNKESNYWGCLSTLHLQSLILSEQWQQDSRLWNFFQNHCSDVAEWTIFAWSK